MGIKVIASSMYLPERLVDNAYYEKKFNKPTGWVEQRTGIITRHKSEKDTLVSDLASKSVLPLLSEIESPIEFLICTTSTPDSLLPSTANRIAQMLNLNNVFCFDLMSGCAGFLQALVVANSLLESGLYRRGMIVAAEKMSLIIDEDDPVCDPIFGDASAAIIVEYHPEKNVFGIYMGNECTGVDFLHIKPTHQLDLALQQEAKNKVYMDGQQVFKNAVRFMAASAKQALDQAKMPISDIDFIIPHQANMRIITAVAEMLDIELDKVLVTINHLGNVVNASIPITLNINKSKLRNKQLLITAFGAGFNYGALIIKDLFME